MTDLTQQAEELGIKVDARWSDETLQSKIDEALGAEPEPEARPPEKLIPMRVNRDFWDAAGVRNRKGTVVDVSVDDALSGAESGALSQVK